MSTLNVGITGSRSLRIVDGSWEARSEIVRRPLEEIADRFLRAAARGAPTSLGDLCFVHGCCIGVDEYVAEWCNVWGIANHGVLPPDRSRVFPRWSDLCSSYEEIETGGYKGRNQRIVQHARWLVGFPEFPEWDRRSLRSGTWQTIRIARRYAMQVDVHLLGTGS